MRDAYRFAMRHFAGCYRPTGKTLIAHAVGTASALVGVGADLDDVVAGLLHAAYPLGDFGTLRRRIDAPKRARVRSAIGASAEAIVFRYRDLAWNDAAIATLTAEAGRLDPVLRSTIIVRIANEIDEYADVAPLHVADHERRIADAQRLLPSIVRLAGAVGAAELGAALELAARETLAVRVPFPPTLPGYTSIVIAPASYAPGIRVRLRTIARRLRGLVRRP